MTEIKTFEVGAPLPRIANVAPKTDFLVTITWQDGRAETVDLAPAILRYKIYTPLRDDPALFRALQIVDDGFALAWADGEIDMASTTIESLATETMTSEAFADFVKRHRYTLDGIAAELGISRRQSAYYKRKKAVPRYIALACAYLETKDEGSRRLLATRSDILREAIGGKPRFVEGPAAHRGAGEVGSL